MSIVVGSLKLAALMPSTSLGPAALPAGDVWAETCDPAEVGAVGRDEFARPSALHAPTSAITTVIARVEAIRRCNVNDPCARG
ncbi:MAG: hypothetical protein M3295_07655 [Chloroflexota bacterium]|nr:hypothetical protein [Chloroflexota bacterium]